MMSLNLAAQNSSIISNRENGVPVDDKDTEDCESDRFSTKSV